jgi:hypothetical protein
MPGNKKPRKAKAKTIGAMLDQANKQKRQRYAQLNDRIKLKNNLPLAHPLNSWKLDKTFKPLHVVLDEQDRLGSILCDEEGRPLMRDEDDQDFMLLVPGVVHMCAVFDLIAAARVWGRQPPGLRAYVLKLANDLPIVEGDTSDARAAIGWMRARIGSMTPVQWSEEFGAAVNRIDAEDARIAA